MRRFKELKSLLLIFVIMNSLAVGLRSRWDALGVDQDVVIIGNLFLFLATIVSFFVARRDLHNANPHAFSRAVMGSIMVKMFLAIIAAFIYISIYKKDLNKPALFICMGLYLVYTFLEVAALTRLLRQTPNV